VASLFIAGRIGSRTSRPSGLLHGRNNRIQVIELIMCCWYRVICCVTHFVSIASVLCMCCYPQNQYVVKIIWQMSELVEVIIFTDIISNINLQLDSVETRSLSWCYLLRYTWWKPFFGHLNLVEFNYLVSLSGHNSTDTETWYNRLANHYFTCLIFTFVPLPHIAITSCNLFDNSHICKRQNAAAK